MTGELQQTFQWMMAIPWLGLCLVGGVLGFIAWRYQVFPTRRWIFFLLVSMVLSLLVVFRPEWIIALAVVDGLLITVAVIDYMMHSFSNSSGLRAFRNLPRTASIGKPLSYELTVENLTSARVQGWVRDDQLDGFRCEPEEHSLQLPRLAKTVLQRRIAATTRGAFQLQFVYIRRVSLLGFWQRMIRLPVESQLNVYPDLKQLSEYGLLARTNRLSLIGVRRTRRIGQDSDFERLRDYARDDNYRHIDWRTTARRRKLTVRLFQSDQSQRLIFMLDCGRMMTNQRAGLSLFDHALNATLMLAYVALQQGDAVGMLCFSDRVHKFVPPRGGKHQMNHLIQAGFDQFPQLVESRYDKAFLYLSNHCKRRSLVTLTTNLIDKVNADQVVDYLGNISGRHLPLGILLRDRQMFDAADHPGTDRQQILRAGVAAEILCWRHQVICDLEHRGVLVVDAFPDDLTAPMVNRYLEIKAKHML